MNPKQKALELVNEFDQLLPSEGMTTGQTPIDCALIAVDEILNAFKDNIWDSRYEYYLEVKSSLIKM